MGQHFFLHRIAAASQRVACIVAVICLLLATGNKEAAAAPTVTLANDHITFTITAGQTVPVDAPAPVRVLLQSAIPWTLTYQAQPLHDGSGSTVAPERICIRTPYTSGFESLAIPRLAGQGVATGPQASEIFLSFRFMPTGKERPGVYSGTVFPREGGPAIRLSVVVEKQSALSGLLDPVVKNLEVALLCMALTPQNVHFNVTGEPKEYDADSMMTLTVSYLSVGNGFVIKAKATPLTGPQGSIPASRIFISADQGAYESLDKDVTVLQVGPLIQVNTAAKASLRYRLETTWDDAAGDYSGQIVFTCAPAL